MQRDAVALFSQLASLLKYATPQTLTIVSSLFAVLCLAVFVLFTHRSSGSTGNSILLVGAPDAGKTTILSALVYRQTLPTHTSLQVNSSILTLPSTKPLRIIDIPGHPRVRSQFQEHLSDAKALVFVVDASTISRNGAAVAEHLHHILHTLTSLPPSKSLPALAVLAHKSDLFKLTTTSSFGSALDDLAVNRVKTVLERELEKRRVSQSGGVGVEGLGEEGERSDMGGLECSGPAGEAFKFVDWEGGEVNFMGSSVGATDEKAGDGGLSTFEEWLSGLP